VRDAETTFPRVGALLLGRVAKTVTAWELVILVGVSPALLFPGRATPFALATLPLLMACRAVSTGVPIVGTRANPAIACLLPLIAWSLAPSFDLHYSEPKLTGLLLGISLYLSIAAVPPSSRNLLRLQVGLLAVTTAVAGVALLGTSWSSGKAFGPGRQLGLDGLAQALPVLRSSMLRSPLNPDQSGINPNEAAGVLVMLLPVCFAIVGRSSGHTRRGWLGSLALGAASVIVLVLIFAQSRSAWVAVLVVGAFVAAKLWSDRSGTRSRTLHRILLISLVILAAGLLSLGPTRLLQFADEMTSDNGSGLGRVQLWAVALKMLAEHPVFGVGLNTFQFVMDAQYRVFPVGPALRIPHAHNILLQTAIDLGVPGALAFMWLVGACALSARRAWNSALPSELRRLLVTGALGSAGFFIFGLTDAVALGAKGGVFFWVDLGLVALAARGACLRRCESSVVASRPSPGRRLFGSGLVVALLLPMMAAVMVAASGAGTGRLDAAFASFVPRRTPGANWEDALQYVWANARPDDLVLLHGTEADAEMLHAWVGANWASVQLAPANGESLYLPTRNRHYVWLVENVAATSDPMGLGFRFQLDPHRRLSVRIFGDVTVRHYELVP